MNSSEERLVQKTSGERTDERLQERQVLPLRVKLDGRRYRGSTGTTIKRQAIAEERRQRDRLEKSYSQVVEEEGREQRRQAIQQAADEFLLEYKLETGYATDAV